MKNKYYFLNIDFGKKLTGIERSSFKRAILFSKYLNIIPDFITANLNLKLRENWCHYQDIGWVPKECELINIYEDIMETHLGEFIDAADLSHLDDFETIIISDTHERKISQKNSVKMYVVWKDVTKSRLEYINYFYNGKKIKRDKFNQYGQLAVSQYLIENNVTVREDLFRPTGQKCMTQYYENSKLISIEIFDQFGIMHEVFKNQHEFLEFWLKDRVYDGDIYINDKNRIWSKPLSQIRKVNDIKVLSIIHSTHLLVPYEDILAKGINYNYKPVLEGEHIVDACVVLTPQQRDDIAQRFNHKYTLMMIPHANDVYVKKVNYSQRNKNKIITLARLGKEKQIDHMIQIMALVVAHDPNMQLYIYGEGAERNNLQKMIEEKNLENNIFLKGYTENITAELNSSILFLATSKIEGFHMATLESLSHGVPVISYDFKYGPRALIVNNENGIIVEKDNTTEAANVIINVLGNKKVLEEMSEHAYLSVQKYHMENVAKIWHESLKAIRN